MTDAPSIRTLRARRRAGAFRPQNVTLAKPQVQELLTLLHRSFSVRFQDGDLFEGITLAQLELLVLHKMAGEWTPAPTLRPLFEVLRREVGTWHRTGAPVRPRTDLGMYRSWWAGLRRVRRLERALGAPVPAPLEAPGWSRWFPQLSLCLWFVGIAAQDYLGEAATMWLSILAGALLTLRLVLQYPRLGSMRQLLGHLLTFQHHAVRQQVRPGTLNPAEVRAAVRHVVQHVADTPQALLAHARLVPPPHERA
ncbi:hypothetical protein F0P96_00615 [Hymenobacter busanensis]|uniref:Uncharacterized protein n=1 Tax=Hymenobacter busanensis TaxID=2607656 RepID=A0A7L4ZUD1_9BACT|nr:hypothetical protein [Hymenobacter busanensis]KAA9339169.1 hypothetical protein F0P96_00615 [Hymenobacter busanensis]QHJ07069.1 hypothetical protein GUY19_07135 [Hymenobacter busanensis]